MPRYRSNGGLDDAVVDDGDIGFLGINLRNPIWQLEPGILSLSENGRIDGEWTPRRGMEVVSEGSLAQGNALRLRFWLIDRSGGAAVAAASRVDEVVTLTVTGHGLPTNGMAQAIVDPSGSLNRILYTAVTAGDVGNAISIVYLAAVTGAAFMTIDVNENEIRVTPAEKSTVTVSGSLTASDGVTSITFPQLFGSPFNPGNWNRQTGGDFGVSGGPGLWTLTYYNFTTLKTAAWSSTDLVSTPDLVTTWTPQSLETGTPVLTLSATVADNVIDMINVDPIASTLVTAANDGPGTGAIAPIGPIFLSGGSEGAAYLILEGVGGFTEDPNGSWMMTPTDPDTLTFSIPNASGSETYTGLGPAVVLARLDDTATTNVLGSCLFSDPSSNNDESIFMAFGSLVRQVSLSDGTVTTIGLPGSETLDAEVNMIQAMEKVFIFRAGEAAMQWQKGDTDFSLVPFGTFTQPQVFDVTGTFVDVVDGLCTITGLTNNTVATGDTVFIYTTDNAKFLPFIGEKYFVTFADATSFRFYISVANLSTIGANTLSIGKQVSVGGGYIFQPAFPWAIYFQRRLWGPYWYDWSTVPTPDAFVSRDIRDELVASDILDADTYDTIENQFRITPGVADYIVALHTFSEDKLIVLNRNSIHQIKGTQGSLLDTEVTELTREIGCLARKSVVTQGNAIFFLSDNGVYVLEFLNDYNLRGMEEPLSKKIQPYIDRISQELAPESVGIYFNNRYWLAVPLDSTPKEGDAIGNNSVLVFNLLNREWESVDTFGDENFLITNFIIGSSGARNDLYAVTDSGGIHAMDKLDEDFDRIATNPEVGASDFPIASILRTRGFLNSTGERKRFMDLAIQMQSGNSQTDIGITFATDDPDNNGEEILASSTMSGPLEEQENADVRTRIGGLRGFNGMATIRRVLGRPSIRGVRVSATTAARANLTQK